ncbi:MAG: adenylate/guanylate cyclase domain-containing protein [Betaproteobacteria bacterium]|nr:adenylate/guanylate cyclase domain-containing protein [Betaproteobacteria bacterium]
MADRTERTVGAVLDRVRLHLDPVLAQSEFISRMVSHGEFDPASQTSFLERLATALAASPQVASLALIGVNDQQLRVERLGDGVRSRVIDMQDVPGIEEALDIEKRARTPHRGELVWSPPLNQPLINLRTPIWRKGDFAGALFATVTVTELSRFLSEPPAACDTSAFILYGRDHVLAHPALAKMPKPGKPDRPLFAVNEFPDKVLNAIWGETRDSGAARELLGSYSGHVVGIGGTPYVFVYRELAGYGDRPWLVGSYFPLSDLEIEVQRLWRAAWIGIAILAFTVVVAWSVGTGIGRPVRRLAEAAGAIRNFDLGAARPLRRSYLREIDEASAAYNALTAAARWFETYVPRRLVTRLMAQGGEAAALETRVLTIMFTDVAGFTGFAEQLSAVDTAGFLNHHFAVIAECVEREGGTIDKFIGDAVMAFWGAPERQVDHAARAYRAVCAIAGALAADNARRKESGLAPVKVRMGLHSGPVIVGNIGAPGRMNYTIVGDAVNVAQRLEQLGRDFLRDGEEIVALASASTVSEAGASVAPQFLGEQRLRGRDETIAVYRVV